MVTNKKILTMSTLEILKIVIHLCTKFTLNKGLKTLNSGKTLKTFISVDLIILDFMSLSTSYIGHNAMIVAGSRG